MDISKILKPRAEARAARIEQLAARLAGGEQVSPEDIERLLVETGATADLVQGRIDVLSKRAALRSAIAAGAKASKRLEAIDADIGVLFDAVSEAQAKHAAACRKHEAERIELRHRIERGEAAEGELLSDAVLSPADSARLREARDAERAASAAISALRRSLPDLRSYLGRGQSDLEQAAANMRRHRGDPDFEEAHDRALRAVESRRARIEAIEADLAKRVREQAEAATRVAAVEGELRRS